METGVTLIVEQLADTLYILQLHCRMDRELLGCQNSGHFIKNLQCEVSSGTGTQQKLALINVLEKKAWREGQENNSKLNDVDSTQIIEITHTRDLPLDLF